MKFKSYIIFVLTILASINIAIAADIEHGEQIFTANCSACHAGGNNGAIHSSVKEYLKKFYHI